MISLEVLLQVTQQMIALLSIQEDLLWRTNEEVRPNHHSGSTEHNARCLFTQINKALWIYLDELVSLLQTDSQFPLLSLSVLSGVLTSSVSFLPLLLLVPELLLGVLELSRKRGQRLTVILLLILGTTNIFTAAAFTPFTKMLYILVP